MEELTGQQKIFTAFCKSLDIPIPTEQIAICLCILNDSEIEEVLHYIASETSRIHRLMTTVEVMEYLHDYILEKYG